MNKFTRFLLLVSYVGILSGSFYSHSENVPTNISGRETDHPITVSKIKWGEINNQSIWLITLKNKNGMEVSVTNWGAYIQSIKVVDNKGNFDDVILGYDTFEEYFNDCCFIGATVGRYGNRIHNGRFSIAGKQYQLTKNNGTANHLHGGKVGFNKKYWQTEVIANRVIMTYLSKDGEEGYPGNLTAQVIFSLNEQNTFTTTYIATTDKATPVNLISHMYFNLKGNKQGTIEDHQLWINANKTTEVDASLIPTGRLSSVTNSPFDFNNLKNIGLDLRANHEQIKLAGGYDHNWVFADHNGHLKHQVTLFHQATGREMKIFTSEPGIQVYTGNFFNGLTLGKNGVPMIHRAGVALEAQHFPDSPNQPNFPSTILKPGEQYQQTTQYSFSVK